MLLTTSTQKFEIKKTFLGLFLYIQFYVFYVEKNKNERELL